MEISTAIRTRRSIRKYKPDPVPRQILEEIIDVSQWAGSPMNIQPYECAVVGSDLMKELKVRILEKLEVNESEPSEFATLQMKEPYSQRAVEYRTNTDSYQFPPGTDNLDERRRIYRFTAETFRDAPNAIIIYSDKTLGSHPYVALAVGLLAQSICLAALPYGLGTCVMAGRWSGFLKQQLKIPESKIIICSIGIGYPDHEARINNFPRTRIPLTSWVHWCGF